MAPLSHIVSLRQGRLFSDVFLPLATTALAFGAALTSEGQDAKPSGSPAPSIKAGGKPKATPLPGGGSSPSLPVPTEKEARTPAQMKLDSHIVLALKKSRGEPPFDKATTLDPDLAIRADGRVLVDLEATVSVELLENIARLGGEVIHQFPAFRSIRAVVPLAQLEALGGRADVKFISPAAAATTNQAIDSGKVTPSTDGTTKPKP